MKKLPPDEAANINPLGRGKHSWLYREMAQLKQGEAIIVEHKEWKGKREPYAVMRKAAQNLNYKITYGRMPDRTGWIVKRTA